MFQGYSQETVDFMWGIRFNNERGWFMDHKEMYQKTLLEPTKELAAITYEAIHEMLPDEPLMVKVSRIYRDARRLHGRGPYKDHLWFCVRTGDEDWTGRPTFYFEITPDGYSYGLGFWQAPAVLMEAFRKDMDAHPEKMEKLVNNFNKQGIFHLDGPCYARAKGSPPEILNEWYQKKSLTMDYSHALDEVIFTPELATEVTERLKTLVPFYLYFRDLCAGVPQDLLVKKGKR